MHGDDRLRVAILWQGMSGYAHSAFAALQARGVDVVLFHSVEDENAPYDDQSVTRGLRATPWHGAPDPDALETALDDFAPHALLVSSWHIDAYRRAARRRRGRTVRVLCMDNQWWATPKQRLGAALSPLTVRPAYDAAFLPSERSADFARRLGFADDRIIRGLYSCEHDRFAAVADSRGAGAPHEAFVFLGRLVPVKGIDVLADAYRRYRREAPRPWPLLVGGMGPEAHRLSGIPGVEMLGFVQPEDLPSVLGRSGCLVLPSRFEPWAVVVHEAAAAGLPVVCTSVCGAASRLVLDGYNGVIVPPGRSDALARALVRMSAASADDRAAMSAASRSLARQFTPDRWARHLLVRLSELREELGLPAVATATTAGDDRHVSTGL
jgi:glycosyltransferase involved in cell wall biosynthesis